jgi:hypothetical protein
MAARPRRKNVAKALRLAFGDADGVRCWKRELEYFLSQHGVDICLLTERHLRERERGRCLSACKLCLSTNRPTHKSGTGLLVLRGIDHYAVPVLGLTQLEAIAIHITLGSGPLKVLVVYLSPSRNIIGSDLCACFAGVLPIIMVWDLNSKHASWNSWLTTTMCKLLHDYGSRQSGLIYGPHSPITVPYDSSATPDALEIAIT